MKTCRYMGFYYDISRIHEGLGLVYLKLGLYEVPVRISDCEDIG